MILEIKIKLFLNFLINSEDTCRVMKFSGMLNLSIAIYRLQLKHVGCHFRLLPEVKKEIEIFKDNLSNQTVLPHPYVCIVSKSFDPTES